MKRLLFAFAALLVTMAVPAAADWKEPNVSGTQEYRLFKYYPEARVTEYSLRNFDSIKMLTAYRAGEENPATVEDIEGRVIKYTYEHNPETSGLEILRNYQNVLAAKGFETIIAGKVDSFPGALIGNGGAEDLIGFWRWQEPGKGMIYVHLFTWAVGEASWIEIVETKAMEQKLQGNTAAMLDALQKTGRVAVYGINFDSAKATIKSDSDAVLRQVLALLTQHAELKVAIEGHTDNAGAPTFDNKRLSENRAGAVKFWLVGHGIDADRLDTAGFGDTKPVAANATEEGRAKNRRVELVRQE
jgi:outer membrane protein OmpA-like peptidoglycan-associated protein